LILGITSEFPSEQTSWRFVPANHEFGNNNNPFPFVETMQIENMSFSANYKNMVGVKIGDLDNSVSGLSDGKDPESRTNRTLTLLIDDQTVDAGETVSVPVFVNATDLAAFQFTMETKGLKYLEVEGGQLDINESNFGIFDEHITSSWNTADFRTLYTDEPLFTLVFEATMETDISDALKINSDVTEAIAFDIDDSNMQVEIAVRSDDENYDKFTVFQNRPNPFTASTKISFYLPTPHDVRLNVYDVSGRVILSKSQYFENGLQEFNIENDNLDTGGVLYYEVSANIKLNLHKNISMSVHRICVAILFGGKSPEHNISLLSARSVIDNLDRAKYNLVLIGIDRQSWRKSRIQKRKCPEDC